MMSNLKNVSTSKTKQKVNCFKSKGLDYGLDYACLMSDNLPHVFVKVKLTVPLILLSDIP